MEPTESAATQARLPWLRTAGARWADRWSARPGRRPVGPGHTAGRPATGAASAASAAASRSSARAASTATDARTRARALLPVLPVSLGLPGGDTERHPSWPALPAAVVAAAGFALGAGFYRAFTGDHALFPAGTTGWSLALLSGVIVGHLVMLGRARWWGGTGSGAALTLAVLLLYGWVPAGMVSLTVVVLVGVARRHRWRQGVLQGAVDILGIGAGALLLAAFGRVPSVEDPWDPGTWTLYTAPQVILVAVAYLAVTRVLLWYLNAPRGDCPPSPAPPWSGRAWSPSPCSASPRWCAWWPSPSRSCCRCSPSR